MFAFSLAFMTWTLHAMEADVRRSVTDTQTALLRATADGIDENIAERRTALAQFAQVFAAAAPAAGPGLDAFFASRPLILNMFDGLFVVDASGRVTYDARHQAGTIGKNLADRAYFRQLVAGAQDALSSPIKSRLSDEPVVVFAVALRGADGKLAGALLASLKLVRPNFLGRLSQAHIGREGYFAVVEKGDHPIFVMHGQKQRILTPAPDAQADPQLAQALAGFEGTLEDDRAEGERALRSYVSLRSAPWLLLAVYPTAEAFAGLQAREREALWVGSALFLVAAGLAWLMAGWLLRPLNQLQTLMTRPASDPGLALPPGLAASAELAAVGDAYRAQQASRRESEDRMQASERRLLDLVNSIPALVGYFDMAERCQYANDASLKSQGLQPADVPGIGLRAALGESIYAQHEPYVKEALAGRRARFEGQIGFATRHAHFQAHLIPDRADGGTQRGFYLMTFDITALKEAQARQVKVERRLRAITDNLPVLISYIDRHERYAFLNATFKDWLGVDPAVGLGRSVAEALGPVLYAQRREQMARCMAGERVAFEIESETLSGRRSLQTVYIPDLASDGTVAGFYTMSTDVTALKAAQQRLAELVRSDTLTGLANRYQFNEILPLALQRSARSGLALALMFLDIDHFKQINDSFGHAAGDLALQEFAQRLLRSVRSTDTVARLAGDEFVVILESLHGSLEPQLVAHKILAEMRRPFDIGGRMLIVTASVGIAYHAADTEATAPDLLARADASLYAAKAGGRNDYRMSSA